MKRLEILDMKVFKAQSLVEIVVIMGIAALAFIVMQVYIQRGIQGKTKFLTDQIIGSQQRAYTAEIATGDSSTSIVGATRISTVQGGSSSKSIIGETVTSTSHSYSKGKIN